MLGRISQSIGAYLGDVALLCIVVLTIAAAVIVLLRLPARMTRRGLESYLSTSRIRHYHQLGLMPSPGRIRRQVRRESNIFIRKFTRSGIDSEKTGLPFFLAVNPWPFADQERLAKEIREICTDLDDEERPVMCNDLARLGSAVEKKLNFAVRVLLFLIALTATTAWQFNTFDLLSSISAASANIEALPLWQAGLDYFFDNTVIWSNVVGVAISAIVVTLISSWLIRYLYSNSPLGELAPEIPTEHPEPPERPDPNPPAPLGRDHCAVRTLNFSGGAFDTVMQIGVAHALLVIKGRAPDAIVGVSGGAVNAAAIAQIIQAGEDEEKAIYRQECGLSDEDLEDPQKTCDAWKKLPEHRKGELQHLRSIARVDVLRECIEAAQQAPGELFDALLPDPYQIDSNNPLHPLQQPRFSSKERHQRLEAVVNRSGLTRLYNDILNVPFSIGTITRVARRYLGFVAANEINDRGTRLVVKIAEAIRLWVLLGVNLLYAAPLVRVVLRAFRPAPRTQASTAGTLIFKFRPLSDSLLLIKNTGVFLVLLFVWVGISLIPVAFGHGLEYLAEFAGLPVDGIGYWITGLIYAVPLIAWALSGKGLTQFERSTVRDLITSGITTLIVFLVVTVSWTLVVYGLLSLPELLRTGLYMPWEVLSGPRLMWRVIAVYAILLLGAWLIFRNISDHEYTFVNRFLRSYNLNDAFLRVHGIKAFLIDLFDPNFFKKSRMDHIVEDSLNDQLEETKPTSDRDETQRKLVGAFSSKKRLEPISVGIAVANTSTGKLDVIDRKQPLVSALVAALSEVPIFPAVEIDKQLYVSGSNVANEPTRALLRYLRKQLNPDSKTVHIYTVSPFPVSRAELGSTQPMRHVRPDGSNMITGNDPGHSDTYLNLIDVAWRAVQLQRFRDATLERRLTELITSAIDPSDARLELPPRTNGEPFPCVRAWVSPIEADSAMNNNLRVIGAAKEHRRDRIAETIADGCRASLQVMLGDAIRNTAKLSDERKKPIGAEVVLDGETKEWFAPCADVVIKHLSSRGLEGDWVTARLPGSKESVGPGLVEVCRHCKIWRQGMPDTSGKPELEAIIKEHDPANLRQQDLWDDRAPAWPHEREYQPDDLDGDPHFVRKEPKAKTGTMDALDRLKESMTANGPWPLPRATRIKAQPIASPDDLPGNERTTVSFLFSGGVFRGVYQMGVLNALNQLDMRPDVIAGASVGAITAAMVADTFSIKDPLYRHARIARLAAVYLAIDRIILTDRFSDFVRDFTLRAADTQFSIRQADRVFRKFDHPELLEFDRNARQVIAGLERLLYINPYQLNEFIRDFRNRHFGRVLGHLRDFGQQVLDRMSVGDEVLGAEALAQLIDTYVVGKRTGQSPAGLQFDDLRAQNGIQFLATTTNLSEGRLEILGERPKVALGDGTSSPNLQEGLLASSAFPGVFRPRWSWELFPNSDVAEQYIDGGVMDNLPIDAVAQFLYRASKSDLIRRRPRAGPHLVVAASLQVNPHPFALASTREELQQSWITLNSRAKELKYNTKIDVYAQTEEMLRRIDGYYHDNPPAKKKPGDKSGERIELLDLEVVAVKPERLCKTFAFHPMLGFKRNAQKASIAHGCASTLLRFGALKKDPDKRPYLEAWRIPEGAVPDVDKWADAFDVAEDPEELKKKGQCWLTKRKCPFATKSLEALNADLKFENDRKHRLLDKTMEEVSKIHSTCLKRKTHLRPI